MGKKIFLKDHTHKVIDIESHKLEREPRHGGGFEELMGV